MQNLHNPEFLSNTSEFHVILWNLNYVEDDAQGKKEFLKAQRMIYKMISSDPGITIAEMAVNIGVSDRQVRKYLKRMKDQNFIVREGGRKDGTWKIIDGDYEDFFERI